MVAEMGVMDNAVVLSTLCFKEGLPSLQLAAVGSGYLGPNVNSLPLEVMDVVDYLLRVVGL